MTIDSYISLQQENLFQKVLEFLVHIYKIIIEINLTYNENKPNKDLFETANCLVFAEQINTSLLNKARLRSNISLLKQIKVHEQTPTMCASKGFGSAICDTVRNKHNVWVYLIYTVYGAFWIIVLVPTY